MTIKDLTVNFSHLDQETLLSDWNWLLTETRLPICITVAGDAFVQDTVTGAVSFLDTTGGTLEKVAADSAGFEALLTNREFVMKHFAVELVAPFLRAGQRPPAGQVFSFKKPPVLGGEYSQANLETTDMEVHFGMLGQIWEQVAQLPPGTPVNIRFE